MFSLQSFLFQLITFNECLFSQSWDLSAGVATAQGFQVLRRRRLRPPDKADALFTTEVNSERWLGNRSFPSSPSSNPLCVGLLREIVCQQVYRDCSGIVMSNANTWNKATYGGKYPLPFWRPCIGLCYDMRAQCASMAPSSAHWMPDCATAEVDYSSGGFANGTTAMYILLEQRRGAYM